MMEYEVNPLKWGHLWYLRPFLLVHKITGGQSNWLVMMPVCIQQTLIFCAVNMTAHNTRDCTELMIYIKMCHSLINYQIGQYLTADQLLFCALLRVSSHNREAPLSVSMYNDPLQ